VQLGYPVLHSKLTQLLQGEGEIQGKLGKLFENGTDLL
jgi:hypothetical protein